MKYHHYIVIHAESADFIKRCTKIIKSLMLNLIVRDIDTFTIYFNGACWLLQEKASVQYFADEKITIGKEKFSIGALTKSINSAAKMAAKKDTNYNFIYISDHAMLDKTDQMSEIVDNLENSDTMPSVIYAYENPCEKLCEIFLENDELSFEYIYEQCTKPVRTTKSSKFELEFSSDHKINVRVFKGDTQPKTSKADITVEAGTTNQVKKISKLYRDKDGVIFNEKDFPKVCNIESPNTGSANTGSANIEVPESKFEPQSLKILGFVEQSKLPIYSLETSAAYVTGNCEVFAALHKKCLSRKKLIICCMRNSATSAPELVYLAPGKNMFEIIIKANPGIVRNYLGHHILSKMTRSIFNR